MKRLVFFWFIGYALALTTHAQSLDDEDGFRRLLRRASTEADRPLVREQRKNKDEEDEDLGERPSSELLTRNRREEEDTFYHTLLSRSESNTKEKRSFDTEDNESKKSGFITREDWTGGASTISDADREELQSLFKTLNADDGKEKATVTRSTKEDADPSVDGAAQDYARWLMNQPPNEIGKALTHKAEVDNKLTQLFFETKRSGIPLAHKHNNKRTKLEEEDYPTSVKYPEPVHWKTSRKKSEAPKAIPQNNTVTATTLKVDNCTTAKCICEQECHPKAANITTGACLCQANAPRNLTSKATAKQKVAVTNKNNNKTTSVSEKATKALAASGPKLCTDDSAHCLCTRACYPRGVAALSPCKCAGDANTTLVHNATLQEQATANALKASLLQDSTLKTPANAAVVAGPEITHTPASPQPAAEHAPVNTQVSAQAPAQLTPAAQHPVAPFIIQKPVAATSKNTQKKRSNAYGQESIPWKYRIEVYENNKTRVAFSKDETKNTTKPVFDPVANSWCAQACGGQEAVASTAPCKCSQIIPPVQVASVNFPPRMPELTAPAQQAVNTQAKQATTAYAYGPAASVYAQPNVALTATAPQQLYAAPAFVNPAVTAQLQPASLQPMVSAPVPVNAAANKAAVAPVFTSSQHAAVHANAGSVKGSVRTTDDKPLSICARSCHPNTVAQQSPCACHVAQTNKTAPMIVPFENILKKQSLEKIKKHYQGCFKDKRPSRDLPERFTRYETTPEACINECQYQNYKFAGVQYGYLCFCGNGFGRYGRSKDIDCNVPCAGDPTRTCGAFWHNSVYSVDGKEYDPSDFDFAKLDKQLLARKSIPQQQQQQQQPYPSAYNNMDQGANVASHLMKAAQAALKAAKKLLPSVSKKTKVSHKGDKVKREDIEEENDILQDKMQAEASLSAARSIIQKTSFRKERRSTDDDDMRGKRTIDEDSEPYDPNNGRDLLVAYMRNVAQYKRQVRSVDEDEEDDDPNEQRKFEYRRMSVGENFEGEFVEQEDEVEEKKNSVKIENEKNKRSLESVKKTVKILPVKNSDIDDSLVTVKRSTGSGASPEKRSIKTGSGASAVKRSTSDERIVTAVKRSVLAGSGASPKKRSTKTGSGASAVKRSTSDENIVTAVKRSVVAGSGASPDKRSIKTGSGSSAVKRSTFDESIVTVFKRSVVAGSGASPEKRSIKTGSGASAVKRSTSDESIVTVVKRSVVARSGASPEKRSTKTGSGASAVKRSTSDESIVTAVKRSVVAGSGASPEKRSIKTGSGASAVKRSTSDESIVTAVKRSVVAGSGASPEKRSIKTGSGASAVKRSTSDERIVTAVKRSVVAGSGASPEKRSIKTGSGASAVKRSTSDDSIVTAVKRSVVAGSGASPEKRSIKTGSGASAVKRSTSDERIVTAVKRSVVAGSGASPEKRSIKTGSGASAVKRSTSDESIVTAFKRSVVAGSGASPEKRSIKTGSGASAVKRSTSDESIVTAVKRSVVAGSGASPEKRSIKTGSGASAVKRSISDESIVTAVKRSVVAGSGASPEKRSIKTGSGASAVKRSTSDERIVTAVKRSVVTGSGASPEKRSIKIGSGASAVKRSASDESIVTAVKRSVVAGSGTRLEKRSIKTGSGASPEKRSIGASSGASPVKRGVKRSLVVQDDSKRRKRRSLDGSGEGMKKRSLVASGGGMSKRSVVASGAGQKRRRNLVEDDLSEATLVKPQRHQLLIDDEVESDTAEDSGADEESGSGTGSADEELSLTRRNVESDFEELFVKRDADEKINSTLGINGTVNANLKSDVERGVDSLLNLVVELYKQQKTIKAFESSVRSLRHDILRELHVPKMQKEQTTKKVREQIQKTARERLHVLTSSIENKISEFARTHPEASRQANLASSLLPRLPLSAHALVESKKEIRRRAAELDDVEDAFNDAAMPDLLREHFKRNAENAEVEETRPRRRARDGEEQLSRRHRDVQQTVPDDDDDAEDDFEKLF